MKCRNVFWISLVFAMVFTCAPKLAQAAPQAGSPPSSKGDQLATHPRPPAAADRDQSDAQGTIPGTYRLTYTLTELDGIKRVGSTHYAIVTATSAPKVSLRLGTKVPIETAELEMSNSSSPRTEISYIDVGTSIETKLTQTANGLELLSHVVQSAVDSQQPNRKTPVIRATDLQSSALLNENKPVIIGQLDMPGSTHSLQIQVEVTRVR